MYSVISGLTMAAPISHDTIKFNNFFGKSILHVQDTGTRVLDDTRLFLRSSIVSF